MPTLGSGAWCTRRSSSASSWLERWRRWCRRRSFEALFPQGDAWYVLPLQVLLAPVLAVLTVIGSMGNGPLAAILGDHGVMFGAIMAFLYSDFVVPPALKINARYYGWRFSVYLGLLFAAAAVVSGMVVHGLFALAGFIPDGARARAGTGPAGT